MIKYSSLLAKKNLPIRQLSDNKTKGGKCLLIAGSSGYYGAAILSATAAYRCGAGYTYLKTSGAFPIGKHPDFLIVKNHPNFSSFQAVAMGPGFQDGKKIKLYIKQLKKLKIKNVILDAEALNFLAKNPQKIPNSWLLTPHEGELARLLNVSSQKIKKNRQKYIRLAQKKWGCIVLLKGHQTLVASEKSIWEIPSGNAALAKAGTGDVLTGMILGFMSQNLNSLQAAKLAAFIHGQMADQWIHSGNDVLSLMASDLVHQIPKALKKIRDGK